jgi:transposase, IS5 family
MQGKSVSVHKKRASTPSYVDPNQQILPGFETPFTQQLTRDNRWVRLAHIIPWNRIVNIYDRCHRVESGGRPPISGRLVIGAVIIKHLLNLSDRETIQQIRENMFMQYFLGYSSFTNEEPFAPSLFVAIRERLSLGVVDEINRIVLECHLALQSEQQEASQPPRVDPPDNQAPPNVSDTTNHDKAVKPTDPKTHDGKLLVDATAAPQNITYPTDLKLINAARIKSQQILDKLYDRALHGSAKPRTYREVAHKLFTQTVKKRSRSFKVIYRANGQQLRFLRRNLAHIDQLLQAYHNNGLHPPLKRKVLDYLQTIRTVYEQQYTMHSTRTKRTDNRIVSIHQPHVRPIVRGKEGKKVEFGSKLQVSLVNGFTILNKLSWDNFNEGQYLIESVRDYKERFGVWPKEVLADQIYCNRENRRQLKEMGIHLRAKPLGRPAKEALSNHVSPGERNPIEGKFGQAKVAYGLDNIRAKLKTTSESWIATITLVLNLINLVRLAPYCLYLWIYRLLMPEKLKMKMALSF